MSDKEKLNKVMSMLIQAHTLLAKSKLNREKYNEISPLINLSKIIITEVITQPTR